MKKLMMAAAVAVFCAGANAATLEWGMANAFASDKGLASGTLYLVHNATDNTTAPDIEAWAATQSKFTIEAVLAQTGTSLADINTTASKPLTKIANELTISSGTAAASDLSARSYGDTPTTGNYYVYLVAISDDGLAMGITTSAKRIALKNNDTEATASWTASNFATYAVDVPEPTSAMLLLLGVAGLALKRKRA